MDQSVPSFFTFLPPFAPRSLLVSLLLWGLCPLSPSLLGYRDPDLSHDTFDRSHSKHPTEPTVQLGHGMCQLSVGLYAQASPTPTGNFPGRCVLSASSLSAQAESSSLAFGTSLLPRPVPHPASRQRSWPWLPVCRMSQTDSDFHWLVSWFHQHTDCGSPLPLWDAVGLVNTFSKNSAGGARIPPTTLVTSDNRVSRLRAETPVSPRTSSRNSVS